MRHKYRRYFLYYLGRVAASLAYLLPIRIASAIAAFFGRCAFFLLPKYRDIAIDNLTHAFGSEKTPGEIRHIAGKVFENLGRNAAELINFPKINKENIDRFIKMEGIDIVDGSFARGKGTIILGSHFGNWELLGLTFRVKGYPGSTIGRKIYFYKYDNWLNHLRREQDINVIYRDESPRKMLKVLKDNKILGIVADQDVDSVEGVFVNFFGRPAFTPVGPVVLARATGASLVPTFVIRKHGHHRFIIEKPIELVDTGNKEADLVTNTQRWSDVIESYIRKYPDQWVWMHRRWKTQRVKK
ncbi:MAG: lysophospholipid acyltransferase family protein [Candidatus Omnitrophica bacterium]|nr:lysophospholipid acyltransferase family protein [Candidatus Omnitrophota bacterium]